MIAWPLEAARAAQCFEHIFVSTDDAEIAEVARSYGAEVPILRPDSLADDYTPARLAARHMLEWVLENVGPVDCFAHIYPTAPMLLPQDIQQGMQYVQNGKNFAYAAQKVAFPIYQVSTLDEMGSPTYLFPMEKVMMRSQDMPACFIGAGQLYCHRTKPFLATDRTNGAIVEIPSWRAIDIDTTDDWLLAEKFATTMMPDANHRV